MSIDAITPHVLEEVLNYLSAIFAISTLTKLKGQRVHHRTIEVFMRATQAICAPVGLVLDDSVALTVFLNLVLIWLGISALRWSRAASSSFNYIRLIQRLGFVGLYTSLVRPRTFKVIVRHTNRCVLWRGVRGVDQLLVWLEATTSVFLIVGRHVDRIFCGSGFLLDSITSVGCLRSSAVYRRSVSHI